MRLMAPLLAFAVVGIGCGDDTNPANSDGPHDAPMSDGPADAPFGVCDPVAQNCPFGEKCTLNHDSPQNHLFCDGGTTGGGEFQTCNPTQTSDDCARGNVCLRTGTVQTCRKFCYRDQDCGTNYCAISIGGTPLHACAQACTVLAQDCSIAGEACYLGLTASGATSQQCSTQGSKTEGMGCSVANDCAPGLICVMSGIGDGGDMFFCRKSCNSAADGGTATDCSATQTCEPFPNQGDLGYCLPM